MKKSIAEKELDADSSGRLRCLWRCCLFGSVCALLTACGTLLMSVMYLVVRHFGKISPNQLFFHLFMPLEWAKTTEFFDELLCAFLWSSAGAVTVMAIIGGVCFVLQGSRWAKIFKVVCLVLAVNVLFAGVMFTLEDMPLEKWYYVFGKSKLIDENFVNVDVTEVEFGTKRNVVLIFAESLEDDFARPERVGKDLIPSLSRLRNENISFDGRRQVDGSGWTVAALVNVLYGIPQLSLHGEYFANVLNQRVFRGNSLYHYFLHHGYNCLYLQGGTMEFAGKKLLFTGLPQVEVAAFDELSTLPLYKANKAPFLWGVDDEVLFLELKKRCADMAKTGKPFFITALTLDTHGPYGYLPPGMLNGKSLTVKETFKGALKLLDLRCYDFVEWIRKQDFGKNTTVIIVGDHLCMNNPLGSEWRSESGERAAYNCFINSAVPDGVVRKDRVWASFDLMPTVLHAAGAKWGSDRMNLGVSLWGNERTLLEKYGVEYCNGEFLKRSDKYLEVVKIR